MNSVFRAFCFVYYILCPIPGLLLLSSFGSMMGSDVGPKLTRGIAALIACPVLTLVGLITAIVATCCHLENTKALWIATAIAATPGVYALFAVPLARGWVEGNHAQRSLLQ